MHNSASVLENETCKFLWDFDLQKGSPNLGLTTSMNVTLIPIVIIVFGTVTKGTGKIVGKGLCRDHPNNRIIKTGQNTEKSPGGLKRLGVTQTPVEDRQLTLI